MPSDRTTDIFAKKSSTPEDFSRGLFLIFRFFRVGTVFDQVCYIAIQSLANLIQHIAVVSNDLVFIILVKNLKANSCALSELISSDSM